MIGRQEEQEDRPGEVWILMKEDVTISGDEEEE